MTAFHPEKWRRDDLCAGSFPASGLPALAWGERASLPCSSCLGVLVIVLRAQLLPGGDAVSTRRGRHPRPALPREPARPGEPAGPVLVHRAPARQVGADRRAGPCISWLLLSRPAPGAARPFRHSHCQAPRTPSTLRSHCRVLALEPTGPAGRDSHADPGGDWT